MAESSRPEWLRRSVNFILALVALIILLPVMLLIALLVRLTSRGPVFYTQVRVGLDRRTNAAELAEPSPGAEPRRPALHHLQVPHHAGGRRASEWRGLGPAGRSPGYLDRPAAAAVPPGRAAPADQRAPGRDEHRGSPPERPTIFAELREHIAEYPLRQRAKPGITGLAQINHHYDRSLEDVRTKV